MFDSKKLSYLLVAPLVLLLFIGKFSDPRLVIFGFNLGLIVTIWFLITFTVFIVYNGLRKELLLRLFLFIVVFLSFELLHIIQFGYNWSNNYSINKVLFFIIYSLGIGLIADNLKAFQKELIVNQVYFICCTMALVGLFLISSGVKGERLSVFGGGPIVFARWMLYGLILTIYLIKRRLPKFLICVVFLLLSIASGSRGPVLALILGFGLSFLFVYRFKGSLLLVLLIIGLIFVSPLVFNRIANYGLSIRVLSNTDASSITTGSSAMARKEKLSSSLDLFYDYPFGIGVGNWAIYIREYGQSPESDREYPHNFLTEIFLEWGIVSSLAFLYFIGGFYLKRIVFIYNHNGSKVNTLLMLWLLFYTIINILVSGDLSDSRILFFVLTFVPLFYVPNYSQRRI